jgi:hypothetical protein
MAIAERRQIPCVFPAGSDRERGRVSLRHVSRRIARARRRHCPCDLVALSAGPAIAASKPTMG